MFLVSPFLNTSEPKIKNYFNITIKSVKSWYYILFVVLNQSNLFIFPFSYHKIQQLSFPVSARKKGMSQSYFTALCAMNDKTHEIFILFLPGSIFLHAFLLSLLFISLCMFHISWVLFYPTGPFLYLIIVSWLRSRPTTIEHISFAIHNLHLYAVRRIAVNIIFAAHIFRWVVPHHTNLPCIVDNDKIFPPGQMPNVSFYFNIWMNKWKFHFPHMKELIHVKLSCIILFVLMS